MPIQAMRLRRNAAAVSYATLNPADRGGGIALTGGNLTATAAASAAGIVRSTVRIVGKRYFEALFASVGGTIATISAGVATSTHPVNDALGYSNPYGWAFWGPTTGARHNGATAVSGTATSGDVFGFAVDADAGELRISKNGVFLAGGAAVWSNLAGDLYAAAGPWSNLASVTMRFDPASWAHAPPSGYLPIINP